MTNTNTSLRKAAVLLRSVDADTATTLLAQLSTQEAASLREAVRALGPVDPDEQADVVAEFRREKPLLSEPANRGVELSLSSNHEAAVEKLSTAKSNGQRFEFLEHAPANTLASFLAREHAQTIAVVLSHIAPGRAAAVLALLPERLQADSMERLSNLGDTDAESVTVLETELAAWVKKRSGDAGNRGRRRDAVASILAAADANTRDRIVANLKTRNAAPANPIEPAPQERTNREWKPQINEYRMVHSMAKRPPVGTQPRSAAIPPVSIVSRPALPRVEFDHLIHADARTLTRLLGAADPTVLALALAGSRDDLVDRVCEQMPKRLAKAFRRELRRMGPTRLSDVAAAQNAIAELAAKQIAERRNGYAHSADERSAIASRLNV